MDAYIMCGGKGTRVAELCDKYKCDKQDLPVDGHKFVDFTIRTLLDSNIVHTIQYIREEGTGTGGAIRFITRGVSTKKPGDLTYYTNEVAAPTSFPYILIYGDMYVQDDIPKMYGNFISSNADLMMITMETSDQDYGLVDVLQTNNKIIDYRRVHVDINDYLTNVGMYLIGEKFHTFVTNYPQQDPLSLERDILENKDILGTGLDVFKMFNVVSYRVNSNRIFDCGTVSRYEDTISRLKW
jgi:NDP-sugar pyrophosphorylase family protein